MPAIVQLDYPIIRTLHLGTEAHYSEDMSGWRTAPTIRGAGHRVIPGEEGVFTRTVLRGKIRFVHEVIVSGWVNPDGDPYVNRTAGLDANLELLYAACAPATESPWTFTATHVREAANRTAQIMVLDITEPSTIGDSTVVVGLDIVIPSGGFT